MDNNKLIDLLMTDGINSKLKVIKILKEDSKDKDIVLTAIDELYSWSTNSGIDPATVLETVKIIENYIGVRI